MVAPPGRGDRMSERRLWVVERLAPDGWFPTRRQGMTRKDGRWEKARMEIDEPWPRFRLVKYVPATIAGKGEK